MTKLPRLGTVPAEISGSGASAAGDMSITGRYAAGRDINIGTLVEAAKFAQPVHQLPADIVDFTGREAELADLHAVLERARDPNGGAVVICALAGQMGVGKSALAIHLAHDVCASFPDAQLYIDLRAPEGQRLDPLDPAEILAGFLRALGVGDEEMPGTLQERAAQYRSRLADKRALVVLDNASREEQVQALLPGSASSAVLITSRSQFTGLDGAQLRRIDVMQPDTAIELLAKVIGDERVKAERDAADALTQLCGYLPLAVRITGGKLRKTTRSGSLGKLVVRLSDERRRLDELKLGHREVRGSFMLSYEELSGAERHLFRRLGLFARPDFGGPVAAALIGASAGATDELLEGLVDAQFVEEAEGDGYRLQDLMRLFARERLEAEEAADAVGEASSRMVNWYLDAAGTANALFEASIEQLEALKLQPKTTRVTMLAWFESERANLLAAMGHAYEAEQWEAVWGLADAQCAFFSVRSHWNDWQHTQELALEAARNAHNRRAEASALRQLASISDYRELWDEALQYDEQSLAMYRQLADRSGEAKVLNNLGVLHVRQGCPEEALACYEQSLSIYRDLGDRLGEGKTLHNLGNLSADRKRWEEAIAYFVKDLQICRELGDRKGEAQTLNNLGLAYAGQKSTDEAISSYRDSIVICRELDDRHSEGEALNNLGILYQRRGAWDVAITCHEQDLAICRDLGDRRGEALALTNLGTLSECRNRLEEAIPHYEQSLAIYRQLGDRRSVSRALYRLGDNYFKLGRAEAIDYLEEALPLLQALNDRAGEADALSDLGFIHRKLRRWDEAIACFEQTISIARELANGYVEGNTLAQLGITYESLGDTDKATALWRDAVAILDPLGVPDTDQIRAWLSE